MRTWITTALFLLATPSAAWAENPLQQADWSRHLSGPKLAPEELEGKVVLLEYFGYR